MEVQLPAGRNSTVIRANAKPGTPYRAGRWRS